MTMTNILITKENRRVAHKAKANALSALTRTLPVLIEGLKAIKTESVALDTLTQSPNFNPNSLIQYRINKKFEIPDDSQAKVRAEQSVRAMLEYDSQGMVDFNPSRMEIDPYVRRILYNARLSFKAFYKNFKYDWSFCGFPSGESYDSSNGDNSLVAKLRNLENWKITPDCFDLFARISYNTLWLRRSAKAHFRKYSREENAALFIKEQRNPFHCFKAKLREIVTFWYGCRLTTVPKNNKTDRVIQVGCMLNMIVQLTIANNHRRHIKNYFDIDLDHSHELHKLMISDLDNATIDWSNASNSNWMPYIKWLLDENSTWHYLFAAREGVVSYGDEVHQLNMLSPMGCGFTFEIMTLTLLIIAREFDSFAHVYGDDVIIHRDCADDYIKTITFLGWNINEEKTFIDGPFRESCGAFYHEDFGYLTSYDMEYPQNSYDAMVLINKLFILKDYAHGVLKARLESLYAECISILPAYCLRPRDIVPSFAYSDEPHGLDRGVMVTRSAFKKLIQRDVASKEVYIAFKWQLDTFNEQYCYRSSSVIIYPILKCRQYRHMPVDNVRNKFWIAHLFKNGTLSRPTKGQPKEQSSLGLLLM